MFFMQLQLLMYPSALYLFYSFAEAEVISQHPPEAVVEADKVFEIREPIDTSQVDRNNVRDRDRQTQ